MTIRTTNRLAGPFGFGTVSLPFNFKVFSPVDVLVRRHAADDTITVLTYGMQYTVMLNGDQEVQPGGVVTLLAPGGVGESHTVTSATPALQLVDWLGIGTIHPDTITDKFDHLTVMIQELRQNGGGTGGGGSGGDSMPLPAPEANKLLGWNGTGTALVNYTQPAGGGGGIPEAPTDGTLYGRKNAAWAPVPAPAPGGGGSQFGKVKIVVLGDSMAAQNMLVADAWPSVFERRMNANGAPCEVINLAIGGYTFNKANTVNAFNGKTMVQRAIDLAPDVVFVNLGANDVVLGMEGRTLGQVQADSDALLSTLRAGLPNAHIIWMREILWDDVSFASPASNLKNKGVPPAFMQLRTNGILAGAYSSEILEEQASTALKNNYGSFQSFATYMAGSPTLNGIIRMDGWRIARLGLYGLDGMHPTAFGNIMFAAYAIKGLRALGTVMASRWPNMNTDYLGFWTDPDTLFTGMLAKSGDGWIRQADPRGEECILKQFGSGAALSRLNNWNFPSGGTIAPGSLSAPYDDRNPSYWKAFGVRPNSEVTVSVNGAAFVSVGEKTDDHGMALAVSSSAVLPPGTHILRYKVDNEIHGPFSISVTAAITPFLSLRKSATWHPPAAGDWYAIPYDTVVANRGGGGYNTSTGIYTAPRAGRYQVTHQYGHTMDAGELTISGVAVNGNLKVSGTPATGIGTGMYEGSACSHVLYLNAGDQVSFQTWRSSVWPDFPTYGYTAGALGVACTASLTFIGT